MVRHSIELSREAVDVPSLAVFKTRLHGVLKNLVQRKLSKAEGLKLDDLKGPFKPRKFRDSMIQLLQFSLVYLTKLVFKAISKQVQENQLECGFRLSGSAFRV